MQNHLFTNKHIMDHILIWITEISVTEKFHNRAPIWEELSWDTVRHWHNRFLSLPFGKVYTVALEITTYVIVQSSSTVGKESACQCRKRKRHGFGPQVRRAPGEESGSLLQYSCLKNFMDRRAWCATVHGVAKCWTWLSTHTCTCESSACFRNITQGYIIKEGKVKFPVVLSAPESSFQPGKLWF